MNKPLVTVYTLVYNTKPQYVIEAIESVYNQKYNNIEHFVVNDAPNDVENWPLIKDYIIAKGYPSTIIENKINQGVCKNINDILSKSKGKYIAGCSDDIFASNFLEDNVEFMESSAPQIAGTFGDAILIDEESNENGNYFENRIRAPRFVRFEDVIIANPICAPSVFLRIDVLKEVGMYDSSYVAEDFQMWLKITSKNYILQNSYSKNIKYRILETGLSNYFRANSKGYREHFSIVYPYLDLLPLQRTLIERRLVNETLKVYKLEYKNSLDLIRILLSRHIFHWKILVMYILIKFNLQK